MALLVFVVCFFLHINALSAKSIKIQIDSDDMIKIFGGWLNSDTFKKFADQVVQRTAIKYGTYNNPYHPEDNLISKVEAEKAANAQLDANLEKENEKYQSGENDVVDQLDDIQVKSSTAKEATFDKINVVMAPKEKQRKLPDNLIRHAYTLAQRRYKLKGSR